MFATVWVTVIILQLLTLLLVLIGRHGRWLVHRNHRLLLRLGDMSSLHVVLRNQLLHIILVCELCRAYIHNIAFELCVLLCVGLMRRVATVTKISGCY